MRRFSYFWFFGTINRKILSVFNDEDPAEQELY